MTEIKNECVFGFPHAMYGMRRALNSHDKSDSKYQTGQFDSRSKDVLVVYEYGADGERYPVVYQYVLGDKDIHLAKKLIAGGGPHRKFMRFIHVQFDLTLPLKVWKQFDTYHHAEKLSDSTMHTGMKEPLNTADFEPSVYPYVQESDSKDDWITNLEGEYQSKLERDIDHLNDIRTQYNQESDPKRRAAAFAVWTSLLPDGYLQTRTVDTNYETLLNIYHQRKGHKMKAWAMICGWIETLPYMSDFLGGTHE